MTKSKKYTKFKDIPQMIRHGNYEIDFDPFRFVRQINKFVEKEGLQLDPDFQRLHVWTTKQQREYIEFFLRGGRTARVIYLNFPSWNGKPKTSYDDFVVVDGKQRIEAWRRFIENEIKVFGSYYREYTDNPRILNTMRMNINDLQTKEEVLQWYIDFNSGGTVHTDEEINKVKKILERTKNA